MGRPDDVRASMQERQRRWMTERTAEETRRDVQRELGPPPPRTAVPPTPPAFGEPRRGDNPRALGASGGAPSLPPPASTAAHSAHMVLDRITERLAERMRTELHVELERESSRAQASQLAASQRAESRLSAEVLSHTCPICYELMAGRAAEPILLVPCGHTLCATCVRRLDDAAAALGPRGALCPVCRTAVHSRAPNVSLRSIVNALVATRDVVRTQAHAHAHGDGSDLAAAVLASVAAVGRGEGGSGWERRPESAASLALAEAVAESARYASQYQSFCMRAAVLNHELADTRAALDAARARTATADAVARHLAAERAAADERARAAAAEAAVLARQECEQRAKADGLGALEAELDGQLDLLARTLQPLRLEADKARLLALQLNPAANLDDGTADAPRNALAQPRPNPG